MSSLPLTVACAAYDRVVPIMRGIVPIEGCDINFFALDPEELFPRVYDTQDFDVAEISASSHILTSGRGDAKYVGIPVFLSKVFRHSAIFIRTDRGINSPADLAGKTIGVPEYQMTAALVARGMLSDEYGVTASMIRWRNGGQEKPGRSERTPIKLPSEIELATIPADKTLNGMLEAGELDGIITAVAPSCFVNRAPNIGRLFPDFRKAEEAYYLKTRMFPIMHLVGIRRTLVESHPWLAGSVYKAFLQAREIALRQMKRNGTYFTMLPWMPDDVAKAEAIMGPDLWPYGITRNRKEWDAMIRWSVEQGLSTSPVKIEQLFAPGTLSNMWDTGHSV